MQDFPKISPPKPLLRLANACPHPLYVVGGSVRDTLAGLTSAVSDWDICAPLPYAQLASLAESNGFTVKSVFKSTGTVKLADEDGTEYEYSCFRSDRYVRGIHVPVETYFTDDIRLDARRRDFTANAVYYDVAKGIYVDPLQGIAAISEKRLTTVAPAEKVFGEDGLRLLRLARQAATLGFTPDEACLRGARANASLIRDISPERIFAELQTLLHAEEKYGVADGAYRGLKLLDETRALDFVLPELTAGRGEMQRADFHDHDVLEHSLRAVRYASPSVRLAALLHDVGKPFAKKRDGNVHAHPEEGARMVTDILRRLKAPKKYIERIPALIQWHMYDFDCQTSEKKLRRFFVTHYALLDDLLAIKQADYSACKDVLSPAPTCVRWQALLQKMRAENVPFTIKQLSISGKNLLPILPPSKIAETLHALLLHTAVCPQDNTPERLLRLAKSLTPTP